MHKMENNAASSGGHELSHQEPAVEENQASNGITETTPEANSAIRPGPSPDADNPDSSQRAATTGDGDRQHDHKGNSNSCGQRRAPLRLYWESEIVPILMQDPKGERTAPGILNELMDRHGDDLKGYEWKSMLRWLERNMERFHEQQHTGLANSGTSRPKSQDTAPGRRRKNRMFPQEHPPGREAQVDFTHCDQLEVTIQGVPFDHLLFDFRLSHSGWTYVEVALGETVTALKQGIQHALQALGAVPAVLRKDRHGSAVWDGEPTEPLKTFLAHYGLEPSLINQGRPNENGGVEKNNGRVKDDIKQALQIRGNADFETREAYENWLPKVTNWINRRPRVQERLVAERECMTQLPASPAPEHSVMNRKVDDYGFINVYTCRYSMPTEVLGEWVEVHLYADHLEVYTYQGSYRDPLVRWDRLRGEKRVQVDPAHLVKALLQKPAAFAGLKEDIKEHLFPTDNFRQAHEKLHEWAGQGPHMNQAKKGIVVQSSMEAGSVATAQGAAERKVRIANTDFEYLQILNLAVSKVGSDAMDRALKQLLDADVPFGYEKVKRLLASTASSR